MLEFPKLIYAISKKVASKETCQYVSYLSFLGSNTVKTARKSLKTKMVDTFLKIMIYDQLLSVLCEIKVHYKQPVTVLLKGQFGTIAETILFGTFFIFF